MPKPQNIENVTNPEIPAAQVFGDRLLNVKQVAEITGMSVQTLNRARIYNTDAPPFTKISKSVRYKMSSLQSWIASKTEFSSTSSHQQASL